MSTMLEGELVGTVSAAAAGDQIAFARIVAAYDDDMAGVAYVVCGDVSLAHEALQSAWALAWRRIGSLRDHERLRAWLVAIAANEARQLVRRRRRRSVAEIAVHDIDDERDAPHGPDPADRYLDLIAAVGRAAGQDALGTLTVSLAIEYD